MSEVIVFREGGYRYIKAQFQYPSGVAAEAGFEIESARAGDRPRMQNVRARRNARIADLNVDVHTSIGRCAVASSGRRLCRAR